MIYHLNFMNMFGKLNKEKKMGLLIFLSSVVSIIVLWKTLLNLTAKEIYWEDGSSFYYRKWRFTGDQYYLTIYVKKKRFGLTYLRKITQNTTFYWNREINTVKKIKLELRGLIRKYIEHNITTDKLKEWDGELFEPTVQRTRDRKIQKILSGK